MTIVMSLKCLMEHILLNVLTTMGLSWSWSYGSWINPFITTYAISTYLMLSVWIPFRRGVLDTTLCDKVCQWLATGQWFSLASSTNKSDRHNITKILLKMTLNTITVTLTMSKFRVNSKFQTSIMHVYGEFYTIRYFETN